MVVPNAVLNLDIECEDNLGLQSADLHHRVDRRNAMWNNGAGARIQSRTHTESASATVLESLPDLEPGQTHYSITHIWPPLPLSMRPGDTLRLQVRAADFQPHADLGHSISYTLRIVTPEELLVELARREHEWRREFEQIIKTQEQIQQRIVELQHQAGEPLEQPQRAARYSQEQRVQQQQISRLKTVRRQFGQILNELEVNQLTGPRVRSRLDGGILFPMTRLINTEVPAAADFIERLGKRYEPAVADQLEQTQAQLVHSMYAILEQMLQSEGYNEAVSLLQDIIKLQRNLNQETQTRLERDIEQLFGEDEPAKRQENQPSEEPRWPATEGAISYFLTGARVAWPSLIGSRY